MIFGGTSKIGHVASSPAQETKGFPKMEVPLNHAFLDGNSLYTPSSYWDTLMAMEPPKYIQHMGDLKLNKLPGTVPYGRTEESFLLVTSTVCGIGFGRGRCVLPYNRFLETASKEMYCRMFLIEFSDLEIPRTGVGKCPFLGICFTSLHIFVGYYIPNSRVMFNWDIYQPLQNV